MEYLVLALAAVAAALGLWGYSQKRGRQGDRRDMLRAADLRQRVAAEKNAKAREEAEAEIRRKDREAARALKRADEAREETADAREEAERIAGKYPRVPAVLLALALGWSGAALAAEPPRCDPPDVSGIVSALNAEGSELASDAAALVSALRAMAASACQEADALRLALASMERSRDLHARLAGIGTADAKAAMDALGIYRAEVPRLTARRFGWTVGVGGGFTLAPADAAEEADVAAFVGAMWGLRVGR